MFIALLIIHVLVAVGLVFVVLLQSGRGAELGAAFGGVGQSTFGRSQSTFITKFTTGLAVVFMATSLSLAFLTIERPTGSVMSEVQTPPASTPPAAPVTPAPPAEEAPATAAPPAQETVPALPQTDAPPPSPSSSE